MRSECELLLTVIRELALGHDVAVISEGLPNTSIAIDDVAIKADKTRLFLRNTQESALMAIRVDTTIMVGGIENRRIYGRVMDMTSTSKSPKQFFFMDDRK